MKNVFLTTEEKEIFEKVGIDPNEQTSSYLLLGTPGTGKSTITRVLANKYSETVYTSSMIKSEYEKHKTSFIEEISKKQHLFLDDITVIQENKFFGDNVNIFEEILLARFDYIEQTSQYLQNVIKEIEFLNSQKHNPDRLWAGYANEEEFMCAMNSREYARRNWLNSIKFVTIINSNLSKSEFKEKISARLFDRIKAHLIIIDIDEKSHRKEIDI